MAKKIIILQKTPKTNYFEVNYLFWLNVPVAQQAFRANASITSAYSGASAAENTALQSGLVLEQQGVSSYPMAATNAQIAADLQSKYAIAQSELNSSVDFNYYGTYWDGSTWTQSGA